MPESLVEVFWIFLWKNSPHLGWSQRSTHAECHRKRVGIMIIKLDLLRRPTNYAWKFGWGILNISCKKLCYYGHKKKQPKTTYKCNWKQYLRKNGVFRAVKKVKTENSTNNFRALWSKCKYAQYDLDHNYEQFVANLIIKRNKTNVALPTSQTGYTATIFYDTQCVTSPNAKPAPQL